ncbi:MAG TPA: hypothetical protein VEF71_01760 [Streptosporangiaceae bacterium]|nr:hypothetical protein [Streptosporangiaceae bacterium]
MPTAGAPAKLSPAGVPARPGGRVRPGVVIVLAYAGLSVLPYWHFWSAGGTRLAGKGGDLALDTWFLDWTAYALAHGHNPLVTDWGNYPFGVNGITNTSLPLLGVLAAPVTLLFGAFVTVTLLFTLAFPLSSLSAYVLLRRWVLWRPAAFGGGLLYGFSPYLVGQGLGHLHLVFVPLPPLIFLVLVRVSSPRARNACAWGAVLALLCVAQFFISAEVLASTAVVGAIGLAIAAAVDPAAARDRWRFAARAIGTASLITAALLGYPLWLLVAGPARISGPAQQTSYYRGNLLAPVVPDSAMHFRVAGWVRLADTFSGNPSENGSYLGPALLLLLIAGTIVLRRRPVVKVAALTTAASFVLSLGSRLTVGRDVWKAVPLPEAALNHIPVLDNTVAARYSLYVMLGAALIFALTLEALRDLLRERPGDLLRERPGAGGRRPALAAGAACGGLACLALVPLLPAWPYSARVTQVPGYFSSGQVTAVPSGSVAVLYPFPSSADATPMLWQIAAGLRFKAPGGRFVIPAPGSVGTPPSDQLPLVGQAFAQLAGGQMPALTAARRSALRAQLRAWDVRAVLVQPLGARPALVVPFFEWLLGHPPDVRSGGISAWYGQVAA